MNILELRQDDIFVVVDKTRDVYGKPLRHMPPETNIQRGQPLGIKITFTLNAAD